MEQRKTHKQAARDGEDLRPGFSASLKIASRSLDRDSYG